MTSLRHQSTIVRQQLAALQLSYAACTQYLRLVKMGLGGGLHCPGASSVSYIQHYLMLHFHQTCVTTIYQTVPDISTETVMLGAGVNILR